jgi:hypothetical protein
MVVYALNPGDSSKKGIIRINLENQKAGNVRDIILNRDLHFEQHGSYLSVPVEINKNDVMVLLLEM